MSESKEPAGKIIEYYSLLFTYPSYYKMILTMGVTSILGSVIFFLLNQGSHNFTNNIFYGVFLFIAIITSDILINPWFKNSKLLSLRRITIISYSGLIIYFLTSLIVSLVSITIFATKINSGIFLSISIITATRTLVFLALSDAKFLSKWLAISIQPTTILVYNIYFFNIENSSLIIRYFLGVMIMIIGVSVSIWLLEKKGEKIWKGGLLELFKGFLYAWAEDNYLKLEQEVSKIGESTNVECDIVQFDNENIPTALLVPYIHPGPFRKMGSSALPEKLVEEYMKKKKREAIVAHGISTHELDIINREDVVKVLKKVTKTSTAYTHEKCTKLITKKIKNSTVTCQVFGNIALISLSLSNKSYDDLPLKLLDNIREEARKKGIIAIVIDAHNSILLENELTNYDVENLLQATMEALEASLKEQQFCFKTGFSRIIPEEWDNNHGIGSSGIASITISLSNALHFTYLVFDGNNMKKGLSEKIQKVGKQIVDDVIVMTSDTHVVNALGATSRGYYPIGEKMNEDKILFYVKENIHTSMKKQEKSRFNYGKSIITDVLVLGKDGIDNLAHTLENGYSLFYKTFLITTSLTLLANFVLIFL